MRACEHALVLFNAMKMLLKKNKIDKELETQRIPVSSMSWDALQSLCSAEKKSPTVNVCMVRVEMDAVVLAMALCHPEKAIQELAIPMTLNQHTAQARRSATMLAESWQWKLPNPSTGCRQCGKSELPKVG